MNSVESSCNCNIKLVLLYCSNKFYLHGVSMYVVRIQVAYFFATRYSTFEALGCVLNKGKEKEYLSKNKEVLCKTYFCETVLILSN